VVIFDALSLALFLYSLRRQCVSAAALSGGVAALCIYAYLGHRLLPIPLLLAVLWCYGTGSPRRFTRKMAAGFAVGFVTVGIPWFAPSTLSAGAIYGDSPGLTASFSAQLHRNAPEAVAGALQHSLRLVGTIAMHGDRWELPIFSPAIGGLLDPLTIALAAVALFGLAASAHRKNVILLLFCGSFPLAIASIMNDRYLTTFHATGLIPVLFALTAIGADLLWDASTPRIGAAASIAAAVAVVCTGAAWGLHTSQAQLSSCQVAVGRGGFLTVEDESGPLLASLVNSLDSRQAVFVVESAPPVYIDPIRDWQWLYRAQIPAIYAAGAKDSDPASWQPVERWSPLERQASFWPPKQLPSGGGVSGVTYVTGDPDAQWFVAWAQQRVPGGVFRVLQAAECPVFRLTAYTLPKNATDTRPG
jgi:hypothetical protein